MTLSQARVLSSPSVVAAGLSGGLAEVCAHTEDEEGSNERSCFTETLRQWRADRIAEGKGWEWVTWHHMASNRLTIHACVLNRKHVMPSGQFEWILLVGILMWFKCLACNIFPLVYLNSSLAVQGGQWPCVDMFGTFSIFIHAWKAGAQTRFTFAYKIFSSIVACWEAKCFNHERCPQCCQPASNVWILGGYSSFIEGTLALLLCKVLKAWANQRCIIFYNYSPGTSSLRLVSD